MHNKKIESSKGSRTSNPAFNDCFMRIFKLSMLFGGICLFIFGCAGNNPAPVNTTSQNTNTSKPAPQPTADEFVAARKTFKDDCARCHMDTGEGGNINIEGKTLKVPSFKRPSAVKDTDADLIEQIEEGGEGMPGFKGKLSADEIKSLVAFVRKEFHGQ